jgi:hypothetical protein
MDRWLRAIVFLALAIIPLVLLDHAAARRTRSAVGTVVMFETLAHQAAVWHRAAVRLDDGRVVLASNSAQLTATVGSRVELVEKIGLLSGIPRYALRRMVDRVSVDEPGGNAAPIDGSVARGAE